MIDRKIYPPDHAPGDCTGSCEDIKLAERRLTQNDERMTSIEGAINVVHQRLAAHDEKIREVHDDIKQNSADTAEVQCYRLQAGYYLDDRRLLFAHYIHTYYDLAKHINERQIYERLKA